ncbi:MAG TPA: hypothetical protein PKI01_03770 [Bacteroidales bacterium]|nr:hypothetical protein [Bacteroidales bacterium]
MEIKHRTYFLLALPVLVLILCLSFSFKPNDDQKFLKAIDNWEEELNSMNYLVMRTSSINLINGFYLSKEQVQKLLPLAQQVEALKLDIPDNSHYSTAELKNISDTYQQLISQLLKNSALSDTLKNEVNTVRELESEIIKRSLLAAQRPGYNAEGCLECHAPPALFPVGSITGKDTKPISASDRKEIDLAHIKGLFGEEGTMLLWNLRDKVDSILNNDQRYVFNSFRCCLIPQQNVADPGIFGQSFVTNEWIEYFRSARNLTDNQWNDYKDLYLIPLRDLVEAKLPGIKKGDKKQMIDKAEQVIIDARKMDAIDFELQKENLCVRLSDVLSIDLLNGEANRQPDERKFMSAILLLFPGSVAQYHQLLQQTGSE